MLFSEKKVDLEFHESVVRGMHAVLDERGETISAKCLSLIHI